MNKRKRRRWGDKMPTQEKKKTSPCSHDQIWNMLFQILIFKTILMSVDNINV